MSVRVRWYGQSAFRVTGGGQTVFIDPFGIFTGRPEMRFAYPPIEGVTADLLLITHEHMDHNAADRVGGSPKVIRSTAGTFETPVGQITAIAGEHDDAAGTKRGPSTIFVFTVDGLRVCHFGDFGQSELRAEQAAAIGAVDLLLLPVGGGPTIGGAHAAAITERLGPRWVVPMHYRTEAISFLEPADAFLAQFPRVHRLAGPEFDTAGLPEGVVFPAVPRP